MTAERAGVVEVGDPVGVLATVEPVVAEAAFEQVVAGAAVEAVVTMAAEQGIGFAITMDEIVTSHATQSVVLKVAKNAVFEVRSIGIFDPN